MAATITLVGCAPTDAEFAQACKATARIEVKDTSKWSEYLTELEVAQHASRAGNADDILTFTDSYVAKGKGFETGRQLSENEFTKDEWQIRERASDDIVAIARTLEWRVPRFGYSITRNCVFEYPDYYRPFA